MENRIIMDDLGGTPIFGTPHIDHHHIVSLIDVYSMSVPKIFSTLDLWWNLTATSLENHYLFIGMMIPKTSQNTKKKTMLGNYQTKSPNIRIATCIFYLVKIDGTGTKK